MINKNAFWYMHIFHSSQPNSKRCSDVSAPKYFIFTTAKKAQQWHSIQPSKHLKTHLLSPLCTTAGQEARKNLIKVFSVFSIHFKHLPNQPVEANVAIDMQAVVMTSGEKRQFLSDECTSSIAPDDCRLSRFDAVSGMKRKQKRCQIHNQFGVMYTTTQSTCLCVK